jgi:metal-sulfur cluster biosynthetic enzyme
VDADGRAAVTISPTTLFCMAITVIIQAIELRVAAVPGISSVDVTVDVQTDWTPEMMTEHGRRVLAEHRATDRSKVLLSPTFGQPDHQRSAACPR